MCPFNIFFSQARDVSDHYPIELQLFIESETTTSQQPIMESTEPCGEEQTIADATEEPSSSACNFSVSQLLCCLSVTAFIMQMIS